MSFSKENLSSTTLRLTVILSVVEGYSLNLFFKSEGLIKRN